MKRKLDSLKIAYAASSCTGFVQLFSILRCRNLIFIVLFVFSGLAFSSEIDCHVFYGARVSSSLARQTFHDSISRVEIPHGQRRPRVIAVSASREQEFIQAQSFFKNYGILTLRIEETVLDGITKDAMPSENVKLPVFAVAKISGEQIEFHKLSEDGWINRNYKNRDSLSDIAKDFLHQEKPTDYTFVPQNMKRTIDLKNSWWEDYYLKSRPLSVLRGTWLENAFKKILNDGLFQRSPKTSRERLYWVPGLNAGAPLTPQRHSIDEAVYSAHNVMHFLDADLVPLGLGNKKLRDIYVIHRTMGEAFTVVISDMLVGHTLAKQNPNSPALKDWIIEPVYRELKMDPLDTSPQGIQNLKKLLRASAIWGMTGNEAPFRELMNERGGDYKVLEAYFSHYRQMFKGDLLWSQKNAANFASNEAVMQQWWKDSQAIRKGSGLSFTTVKEFADRIESGEGSLVERIFEEVFTSKVLPVLAQESSLLSSDVRRYRALSRYLVGQLAVFSRYPDVPGSQFLKTINSLFLSLHGSATVGEVEQIRKIYEQYISALKESGRITEDDRLLFNEMFPIIPPEYVFTYEEVLK